MINPSEFDELMVKIRLSSCTYTDKYCNLVDFGIQNNNSKINLILSNQYFNYLNKVRINPLYNDTEILPNVGQLRVSDGEGQFYATKSYDEANITKCIKRINQILHTGYTITIYPDVYNKTS